MQLLSLMTNMQSSSSALDLRHTWFQSPIRFEDAIGEVIPFARECDLHVRQVDLSTTRVVKIDV